MALFTPTAPQAVLSPPCTCPITDPAARSTASM